MRRCGVALGASLLLAAAPAALAGRCSISAGDSARPDADLQRTPGPSLPACPPGEVLPSVADVDAVADQALRMAVPAPAVLPLADGDAAGGPWAVMADPRSGYRAASANAAAVIAGARVAASWDHPAAADDDDRRPPVPLPASAWLLLSALGGLSAIRRVPRPGRSGGTGARA
jgi:hypothetical protein